MNNKFTHSFLGVFAIATLGTAVLPNQVQASTIFLNSGQVGLNSGTPGQTDTNITYWTKGIAVNPLSPNLFTPADFLKAQGIGCSGLDICGSAKVVAPFLPPWVWIPSLPSAPNARWINWQVDLSPSFYGSPAASVLYAYRFNVPEPTINSAAIEMYWAVDDILGEYTPANANGGPGPYFPDPNPFGVYINGNPLSSSFSGAGRFPEYSASQSGIEGFLNPGPNNWLYVYQRDAGGAYSGTIFCASISVNVPSSGGKPCAAPVPEPSSIIGLAVLSTLGAASTLKRQIKSSKPSEKETTKVG